MFAGDIHQICPARVFFAEAVAGEGKEGGYGLGSGLEADGEPGDKSVGADV